MSNLQVQSQLAVTVELKSVASSPGGTTRTTNGKVELVTLAKTTTLPASGCQPTHLPVFVHRFCDPLGVWIAPDGLVERVNEDDLKELVCGVFTHPIGVQNSQSSTVTAGTLLQKQRGKFRMCTMLTMLRGKTHV